MKTIGTKKNVGTVGLEWVVLDSKLATSKAVKTQLADENNAGVKYGLVFKFHGITMLGTVSAGEGKPSAPSAAAMVALAQQAEIERRRKDIAAKAKKKKKKGTVDEPSVPADTLSGNTTENDQVWLIIEKVADDQYWFLMVRDGVPMPTTDVIIPYDATISLMAEVSALLPVIFSNDPDIRDQAIGAASRVEDKGFEEITAKVRPARAQIKALTGIPASVVLSLLLVLLAMGLWWGYTAWQKAEQRKQAQINAAAASAQQAEQLRVDQEAYDLALRQAVLNALKAGMTKVDTALMSPSTPDVIDGWIDIIENTSINHAGWEIAGFECGYVNALPECSIALTRGPFGINRLLFEDHPDAMLEGDRATYVIQSVPQPSRQTTIRDLPQSDEFSSGFISELQFLRLANVTYSLGASVEMEEPVIMPEKPASMFTPGATQEVAAGGNVRLGVATGDLTLSGAEIWQLRGLRYMLDIPNLSAKSLNMSASRASTGSWTVNVSYAIRTRAEPVLPLVLDSKDQPMQIDLPAEYKASPEDLAAIGSSEIAASQSTADPIDTQAEQPQSADGAPVDVQPSPEQAMPGIIAPPPPTEQPTAIPVLPGA